MAALTTVRAGDWNNSTGGVTPWTSLTGSGTGGVPGSGDTVTISKAVTISQSNTVGSSPATGGTPAITITTGGSIAQTAGTMTVQGDIRHQKANATWTMSAGTTVTFKPAASAQYVWDFRWGFFNLGGNADGENCSLICNGTSGSHCTITANLGASGSLAPYMNTVSNVNMGLRTATYTDISNFGTASKWGATTGLGNAITSNQAVSITNCTLNASSYNSLCASTWDGNLTFSNNIATSSTANTSNGFSAGTSFDFGNNPTSGQRTLQFNSLDLLMTSQGFRLGTTGLFTDNYLAQGYQMAGGTTNNWSAAGFARNFIASPQGSVTIWSSIGSNYWVDTAQDNPHFISTDTVQSTVSITGTIFEAINGLPTTDGGDCVITSTPGSAQAITIQNCVVLPISGTNYGSGVMHTLFGTSTNVTLSVLHNTFVSGGSGGATGGQAGAAYSETGNCTAGQIAAWKANFVWTPSGITTLSYKLWDSGHQTTGGTQDVVSPTNCDYNGSFNCQFTVQSGNTYTHAGNGYQGNFSATPGTHDLADQNPQFVDATRNLSAWGGTTAGGGTATNAGALAALAANPALIGQATTGLIAWVLAGFQPQNANLKNASYPSDPSTADAAGNAWPVGPGIGAMAFLSSATGGSFYGGGQSAMRPTKRPPLSGPQITLLYG